MDVESLCDVSVVVYKQEEGGKVHDSTINQRIHVL